MADRTLHLAHDGDNFTFCGRVAHHVLFRCPPEYEASKPEHLTTVPRCKDCLRVQAERRSEKTLVDGRSASAGQLETGSAPEATTHRTSVAKMGDWRNPIFSAQCACGWESANLHSRRRPAVDDARAHRRDEEQASNLPGERT